MRRTILLIVAAAVAVVAVVLTALIAVGVIRTDPAPVAEITTTTLNQACLDLVEEEMARFHERTLTGAYPGDGYRSTISIPGCGEFEVERYKPDPEQVFMVVPPASGPDVIVVQPSGPQVVVVGGETCSTCTLTPTPTPTPTQTPSAQNHAPSVRIGSLNRFLPNCEGTVAFTATASASDPDGDAVTVYWSNGAVGPTAPFTFQFSEPGVGQVSAWAVDSHGAQSELAQEGFRVGNPQSECGNGGPTTTTTLPATTPTTVACGPSDDNPACHQANPGNDG